jgi:hypothetical protein
MKKAITLIIIIIITCNIKAQDIIHTKDGQEISTKVEEVGIDVVKYKKFDKQTGATYLILKSDIVSIMYEDGEIDVFSQKTKKQNTTSKVQKENTDIYSNSDKNEKQDKFTLVGKIYAAEVAGQYQFFTFNADKSVEYTVRNKSLKVKEQKTYTYNLEYPKLEILQDNLIKRTFIFIDRNTIRWDSQSGFYEFIKL